MKRFIIGFVAVLTCALPVSGSAQPSAAPSHSSWPAVTLAAVDGSRRFVSEHEGMFGGHLVRYRAVVGETIIKDAHGAPAASVFTTSFVALPERISRPVIFIYNGGPGGASDALMFGAMGPLRLVRFDSAAQADPTIKAEANPDSPLDAADLVFIDPPETGYSRILPGVEPTTFRGNDADSFACAQVILRWLEDNDRMQSPVYLAGESYGTLRNVMLARDLSQAHPAKRVAGLIMISQAIRYNGPDSIDAGRRQTITEAANRLPDAAAFAWWFGKIDNKNQTLGQAIAKAQRFARTEYVEALLEGNRLDPSQCQKVAEDAAAVTGIPAKVYLQNNLRPAALRREMLRDQGLVLGQFDGRETEPAAKSVPDENRDWTAAFRGLTVNRERYDRDELKVKGLGDYVSVVPDPYGFEKTWKYIAPKAPLLDQVLVEQMRSNPDLRLMVPQGVFDTTTSMGSTVSLFAQLDIPADRATVTYYPGGHMLYSNPVGRRAFAEDVRAFVTGQPPRHTAIPDIRAPA